MVKKDPAEATKVLQEKIFICIFKRPAVLFVHLPLVISIKSKNELIFRKSNVTTKKVEIFRKNFQPYPPPTENTFDTYLYTP